MADFRNVATLFFYPLYVEWCRCALYFSTSLTLLPYYFSVKSMWNTMKCKRDSFSGALDGTRETHWKYVSHRLKIMWNTSLPTCPGPSRYRKLNNFFSPLLAFTTQKIATHSTDIISAACVAFFWIVNATRNEKSCLQCFIPTAVFHKLLRACETTRSITKPVI